MAIEFKIPVRTGIEATAARKTKVIIDPNGTIDVELTYGNYVDGKFVPASPVKQDWVKIRNGDFLAFAARKPDGAKTYWDNISDDLDAYINKRGLA